MGVFRTQRSRHEPAQLRKRPPGPALKKIALGRILNLTTLAALLSVPTQTIAFSLGGSSDLKGFPQKQVAVFLNPSLCPPGTEQDLQAAIDLWNSVPSSSLELTYSGLTSTTAADLGGLNLTEPVAVACSSDFGTDNPLGCDPACVDAVSAVGGSLLDGVRLSRGLILVNVTPGATANMNNLATTQRRIVLAHELGHVLGLGHSGEPSALMFYSIAGKQRLALHQDDMDGLTYLYPRNELGGDALMACGRVAAPGSLYSPPPPPGLWNPKRGGTAKASSPSSQTPWGGVVALLLPLLLVLSLRIWLSQNWLSQSHETPPYGDSL